MVKVGPLAKSDAIDDRREAQNVRTAGRNRRKILRASHIAETFRTR
jgi:hypothetical protein